MLRHRDRLPLALCEPDHETDPGGRRNHPLLRRWHTWLPAARRRESSFLPIQVGASWKSKRRRSAAMEILYTNCAGLDVHKKTVKVCLLTHLSTGQIHKEFRTYFTTMEELLRISDWLREQGCTHVAF